MQQALRITAGLVFGLAIVTSACKSSTAPDFQLATIEVPVTDCAFGQSFTIDPASLQNEYFPIHVGRQWELEGMEGHDLVHLTVTVLDETQLIGGVQTRVVQERETANGVLVEVSRNYFAETSGGTVCYFGEDVAISLPGGGTSTEGSWHADDVSDPNNPFFPGIFMPAAPRVGMQFKTEGAPGIAEDEGRITGSGQVKVPAGRFGETLRVREFNPLDGDVGFKTFARGVGMIIDGTVKLLSCTAGCPPGS